jgi:hypothetical protein
MALDLQAIAAMRRRMRRTARKDTPLNALYDLAWTRTVFATASTVCFQK